MAILESELREIKTLQKRNHRYSFEELAEISDPVERLEHIMNIIDKKLNSNDFVSREQLFGMNRAVDRGIVDVGKYYGPFDTSPVLEFKSRIEKELESFEE